MIGLNEITRQQMSHTQPTAYGSLNIKPTKPGKENKMCFSIKLQKHIKT